MDQQGIWNHLKSKVMITAGIESIEPKDCKTLALKISIKNQKQVSETTLKRIFGFAAATFEPSLYTKNSLSQYCGYVDWQDFVLATGANDNTRITENIKWELLRSKVNIVNHFMLSAVINKTVIPFFEMVHREFIHSHFQEFITHGALATVLSAPTGYGKTVAICQWINEKVNAENDDDLILYLNSSYLLSSLKTEVNLNYWMMKLIGLDPSQEFHSLLFDDKCRKGKFYFVIDGFDELSFRRSEFDVLIHLLQDLLSIYKTTDWFKIVMLMRDSTWLNWKRHLMADPTSWFVGKMNAQGQNVYLLTQKELMNLMGMDRPFTDQELMGNDFEKLRWPLFHQIFYKHHKSIIRYDQFTEVLVYEIVSYYIIENIVHGNQKINKIDLVFHLISLMEFISGEYCVDKLSLKLKKMGR